LTRLCSMYFLYRFQCCW